MVTQYGDFIVLEHGTLEEKEEAAIKLVKLMYKALAEKGHDPKDYKIEIIHKDPKDMHFIPAYPNGTVALKWTRR